MTEVGSICRTEPATSGGRAALVLITGGGEAGYAAATLLSPDVELGTSLDLIAETADTGLAYRLLVESDLFGSVPLSRLGPPLARVTSGVLDALEALRDEEAVYWPLAGPPVWAREDPRWTFKLAELARLSEVAE